MFESMPIEAWTTLGGAGGIALAIWRGLSAVTRAAEAVRAYFEASTLDLKADADHRVAEVEHWAKEETAFNRLIANTSPAHEGLLQ